MNISKILKEIKTNTSQHSIFLGFSGGPDSIMVLELLTKIFDKKDIYLLHFDHSYRENSFEEQNFLSQKYKEYNFIKGKYSGIPKEKQRREKRYEFFYQNMKNFQNPILFLGHNLNDRIETSILNSIRGCQIDGFLNMKKIQNKNFNGLKVYRPLLEIQKDKILEYLEKNKIDFLIDKSNFDENLSQRNFVRKIINKSYNQNKNYFLSWKDDFSNLEKINTHFDYKILQIPYPLKKYCTQIIKFSCPQNLEQIYKILKFLKFGEKINKKIVNIIMELSSKNKGMIVIGNNTIYVNTLGLYFLNCKPIERRQYCQENIKPSEIAILEKQIKIKNIHIRYVQSGDKIKGKSISKWAINKKIPAFLRTSIICTLKEGKIIYGYLPYDY